MYPVDATVLRSSDPRCPQATRSQPIPAQRKQRQHANHQSAPTSSGTKARADPPDQTGSARDAPLRAAMAARVEPRRVCPRPPTSWLRTNAQVVGSHVADAVTLSLQLRPTDCEDDPCAVHHPPSPHGSPTGRRPLAAVTACRAPAKSARRRQFSSCANKHPPGQNTDLAGKTQDASAAIIRFRVTGTYSLHSTAGARFLGLTCNVDAPFVLCRTREDLDLVAWARRRWTSRTIHFLADSPCFAQS